MYRTFLAELTTNLTLDKHARIQGGGARGPLAPPPPHTHTQNIAPPNSEARAKRALPPPPGDPYKILDPPMTSLEVLATNTSSWSRVGQEWTFG